MHFWRTYACSSRVPASCLPRAAHSPYPWCQTRSFVDKDPWKTYQQWCARSTWRFSNNARSGLLPGPCLPTAVHIRVSSNGWSCVIGSRHLPMGDNKATIATHSLSTWYRQAEQSKQPTLNEQLVLLTTWIIDALTALSSSSTAGDANIFVYCSCAWSGCGSLSRTSHQHWNNNFSAVLLLLQAALARSQEIK